MKCLPKTVQTVSGVNPSSSALGFRGLIVREPSDRAMLLTKFTHLASRFGASGFIPPLPHTPS